MGFVHSVGRATVDGVKRFRGNVEFLGETVANFLTLFVHPRYFRFGDFLLAFQRASFEGLPVTMGVGFLLGVILAFQSAAALEMFGVKVFIADLLAIALFRELGPIITAVILAGRSGSAFAAEIGTMKVNEELDALTTMGLPPVRFLVLPRVLAAALAMPVLTIFSELIGLLGGAIVLSIMDIPTQVFWRHVMTTTTVFMIALGLVKSVLFGVLIGIIGCCTGMRTRSTADGVGSAATSAVVGGIVAIAVSDGILAVLCYLWHL